VVVAVCVSVVVVELVAVVTEVWVMVVVRTS
jgi:hypothetical protein